MQTKSMFVDTAALYAEFLRFFHFAFNDVARIWREKVRRYFFQD